MRSWPFWRVRSRNGGFPGTVSSYLRFHTLRQEKSVKRICEISIKITPTKQCQLNTGDDVLKVTYNNKRQTMKNVIIFAILTAMSTAAVAGHHKVAEGKHKGGHKMSGLFEQADLDKNDSISSAEHEAAILEMADIRRARFMAMDANGDGAVSREEAKTARKVRYEKSTSAMSGE